MPRRERARPPGRTPPAAPCRAPHRRARRPRGPVAAIAGGARAAARGCRPPAGSRVPSARRRSRRCRRGLRTPARTSGPPAAAACLRPTAGAARRRRRAVRRRCPRPSGRPSLRRLRAGRSADGRRAVRRGPVPPSSRREQRRRRRAIVRAWLPRGLVFGTEHGGTTKRGWTGRGAGRASAMGMVSAGPSPRFVTVRPRRRGTAVERSRGRQAHRTRLADLDLLHSVHLLPGCVALIGNPRATALSPVATTPGTSPERPQNTTHDRRQAQFRVGPGSRAGCRTQIAAVRGAERRVRPIRHPAEPVVLVGRDHEIPLRVVAAESLDVDQSDRPAPGTSPDGRTRPMPAGCPPRPRQPRTLRPPARTSSRADLKYSSERAIRTVRGRRSSRNSAFPPRRISHACGSGPTTAHGSTMTQWARDEVKPPCTLPAPGGGITTSDVDLRAVERRGGAGDEPLRHPSDLRRSRRFGADLAFS